MHLSPAIFKAYDIRGIVPSTLDEEVAELKNEMAASKKDEIEGEIGDLLFVIVNLARKLDVEPETALKRTNRKFRKRFKFIENELKTAGRDLGDSDLREMDDLWNKAKAVDQNSVSG